MLQFYLDIIRSESNPSPTTSPTFHLTNRIHGISTAAIASSNYHMGALVLEEMIHIIDDNDDNGFDGSNDMDMELEIKEEMRLSISLRLSEIYRLTKEEDVVRSIDTMMEVEDIKKKDVKKNADEIFLQQVRHGLKRASDEENKGHREQALKIYNALYTKLKKRKKDQHDNNLIVDMGNEVVDDERTTYVSLLTKRGMLKCSIALQRWDLLNDSVLNGTGALQMEHSSSNNHSLEDINHFIQYCLTSQTNEKEDLPKLLQFFDQLDNSNNSNNTNNNSSGSSSSSSSSGSSNERGYAKIISQRIKNAHTTSFSRDKMRSHFSMEAALTYMASKSYERALPLLDYAMNDITKKWTELHPLANAERHLLLGTIPMLETMQHTMDLRRTFASFKSRVANEGVSLQQCKKTLIRTMSNLITSWNVSIPDETHDDPSTWNKLRNCRSKCLQILNDSYTTLFDSITDGQSKKSIKMKTLMEIGNQTMLLECAQGMNRSGSYDVADVYLSTLQSIPTAQLKLSIPKCVRVYYQNIYSDISRTAPSSFNTNVDGIEEENDYSDLIHRLNDIEKGTSGCIEKYSNSQNSSPSQQIQVIKLNFLKSDCLSTLSKTHVNKKDTLNGTASAMNSYQHSISLISTLTQQGDDQNQNQFQFWTPILRYAMYCSQLLDSNTLSESMKGGREHLVIQIVTYSLKALHLYVGEGTAKRKTAIAATSTTSPITWFPRVLSLLRPWVGCDSVVNAFDTGTRSLPSWVLLRWNPQLLSLCGGHKYTSITKIIVRNLIQPMLFNYPDAVYFNFIVMCEHLDIDSLTIMQPLLHQMQRSPKGKALNTFSAAIRCTLLPQNRLIDGIEVLGKMFLEEELDGKSKSNINLIESKKWKKKRLIYVQDLLTDVFGKEKNGVGKHVGSYQREFTRRHKTEKTSKLMKAIDSFPLLSKLRADLRMKFKDEVEKDFRKKSIINIDTTSEWFQKYDPDEGNGNDDDKDDDKNDYDSDGDIDMQETSSSSSSSSSFASASSTTTSALYSTSIEVPGLYDCPSFGPPRTATHPTIASFGNTVLQLSSVRKPRRLTVIGSDYKVRYLLCKGGEDMRNDQRIEQLFTYMNTIFVQHNKTRALKNITYSVIPMTSNHGVVEWLNDTEPLKEAYTKQVELIHQENDQSMNNSSRGGGRSKKKKGSKSHFSAGFSDFVKKETKINFGDSKAYIELYKKSRNMQKDWLKIQQDASPSKYLLRNRLLSMSNSSECFHQLRRQTTRCIAVNSICGYLLGMGKFSYIPVSLTLKTSLLFKRYLNTYLNNFFF